jgi:hypothetical protein
MFDYKSITATAPQVLTINVGKEMEAGWVPSGPVVVFGKLLIQAMVRFEEA